MLDRKENNILASTITTPDDLDRRLLTPLFEIPIEAYFLVVPVWGYDPDASSPEDLRPGRDALPSVLQEALNLRFYIDGNGEWALWEAETGRCWPRLGWVKRGQLTLPNYNCDHVVPAMARRVRKAIEAKQTHYRWRVQLTTSEYKGREERARSRARVADGAPAETAQAAKPRKRGWRPDLKEKLDARAAELLADNPNVAAAVAAIEQEFGERVPRRTLAGWPRSKRALEQADEMKKSRTNRYRPM